MYANVVCVGNIVRASWAKATDALSYTGVLTSPSGSPRSCSTSGLSCDFSGLTCAQTYTLRVFASNICNGSASTGVTVTTGIWDPGYWNTKEILLFFVCVCVCSLDSLAFAGPCDPNNVVAQVQCGSGAVIVSWQASAGANAYTVQAYTQSQTVPSASCVTSNTTCTFAQLQCGTVFNVSVLASDGTCNSSPLAGTTVKTGMRV